MPAARQPPKGSLAYRIDKGDRSSRVADSAGPSSAPASGPHPRGAFDFRFVAKLESLDFGRMVYRVLYLPPTLQRRAPFVKGGRLRMRGTIGGQACALAWLRSAGRFYLLVGKSLQRAIGARPGDRLEVCFSIADGHDVPIPEELAEAIRQEPAWAALWGALTPGARRGHAFRVESAKRPATRVQRAIDIMRSLEDGPTPRRRRDALD